MKMHEVGPLADEFMKNIGEQAWVKAKMEMDLNTTPKSWFLRGLRLGVELSVESMLKIGEPDENL